MKIAKIIDAELKTGVAKTGKPYTIAKVELSDGTTATGFQPISEGDEVEVTPSDYGLQFKTTKKASGATNDDTSKLLNMIYEKVSNIEKLLEDSQALQVFDDDKS